MNKIIAALNREARELEKRLIKTLVEENKHNSSVDLTRLIRNLIERRDSLEKLTDAKRLIELDDTRIQARNLNEAYASILSDLYSLFGASNMLADVIKRYEVVINERNNRISSLLREQEGRIKAFQLLKNRPWNLEGFSQDLAINYSEEDRKAVFSKEDKSLSLDVLSSQELRSSPVISVTVLGDVERQTLPNYQIDKVFDSSRLTSWYEIVGYKSQPIQFMDFKKDNPLVENLSALNEGALPGATIIKTSAKGYKAGDKITIGNIFSINKEEATVVVKNNDELVVTPLVNQHFFNDPIYLGTDLVQTVGAVAVIDCTFPYSEKVNFIRMIPFSSQPIKIHGIFYSNGRLPITWTRVEDTYFSQASSGVSFSFEQKIVKKLRIIIEQTSSEVITKTVSSKDENDKTAWEVIYENEFNRRLPELEKKLEIFTESEIIEANYRGERGFLARKPVLDFIRDRVYKPTEHHATEDMKQELSIVEQFIEGKTIQGEVESKRIKRYVYELGITEIELFNNMYRPYSEYLGKEITPKQVVGTYSLFAKEVLFDDTSVQHFIELNSGEEIPIVNQSNVTGAGEVVSKNELLDIQPVTRIGVIKFRPFRETIQITSKGPNILDHTFTVAVEDGGIVVIPENLYNQKLIYQTTYTVAEPDVDVISNIESETTVFTHYGTTDGIFLELETPPYIEPGIINDRTNWKKRSALNGIWDYILPLYNNSLGNITWIDEASLGKAFPLDGIVLDNVYYGRGCETALFRTPILEVFLYSMFSRYSGDVSLRVERFFNKYVGQVLKENLSYEPIVVRVDNKKANNLSMYDGSPDSGFITELGDAQFRHFSNRIQFTKQMGANIKITIEYNLRASTVRYKAQLFCNKKSRFFTSPLLKEALLVTAV